MLAVRYACGKVFPLCYSGGMTALGIIGFGQFGQLAARHLARHFDITVFDRAVDGAMAEALGVSAGSFEDCCACGVVMLAVPVRVFPDILARMAPLLRPGTLVVDVASVKVLPARLMAAALREDVEIVATHPLFGPQSARNGLRNLTVAVCAVRGAGAPKVAAFCEKLGLRVVFTTPEEHDREMAYVQALTHLIGRTLGRMGLPDERLKTQSYQHLLELCDLLKFDTLELFTAIQRDNPFAAEISNQFVREAASLLAETQG